MNAYWVAVQGVLASRRATTDTDVLALFHFDGSDASTSMDDSSSYNNDATSPSGIALSTTRSQFGASSLKITDERSGGVSISGAEFARTAGEAVTFDFWVYWVSSTNSVESPMLFRWSLVGGAGDGSFIHVASYGNTPRIILDTDDFGEPVTPAVYSANAWHHVRVVISASNEASLALDGTRIFSSVPFGSASSTSGGLAIGGLTSGTASACEVYMDEFRMIRGIALPDDAFTPPTEAFPNP